MPPPEEIGEKLDNLRSPEWNFKTPGGLNMFSPPKRFVVQREKGEGAQIKTVSSASPSQHGLRLRGFLILVSSA